MGHDDLTPAEKPSSNLPAQRSFTTPELEAVIRRALELQAGQSARGEDGVSREDVERIGQELGLEASAVRRAMAEVRSRPPTERGALDGFVGEATVRATRVVERPAAEVASLLDRHLRGMELMVPQRRFAERTRYVRDSSITAGITRVARSFSRPHRPLNVKQLDVSVSPLDSRSCLVALSIDLAVIRGGLLAGVFGSGSAVAAGWATAVWATPIADPLMLLGVPLLAGAWAGTRAIYGAISRSGEDRLETLLDRLEHGELG